MGDVRLQFADLPFSWRVGAKQNLLGSDYAIYDPKVKVEKQPTMVEIDVESNQTLLFGSMSRFVIDGTFESKTDEEDWTPVAKEDWENVVVAPNWLDMLIKDITVSQGHSLLSTALEARHISPFLNAYLYFYMDPLGKKLLCPQESHPGNGVPSKSKGWTWNEADGTEWKNYATTIFTEENIEFDYIPMHVFPFFQRANMFIDNNLPSPLPMPALGKLSVCFLFNDKLDNIFKKKAGNVKKYRFAFNSIKLIIEQARLSPTFERNLYGKKTLLPYGGVTKIMTAETINGGNLAQRIRFEKVPFPEGIFIFALPKKCLTGNYDYQDSTDDNVFSQHNLDQVMVQYNGFSFHTKEPNISMIENNLIKVKSLIDHLVAPPFGMSMDPQKISLESIGAGGKNTPYPHAYINLCNFANKSRIVPLSSSEASIFAHNHDLDIHLKFQNGGATPDTTYIFYMFFTDTNIVLDMKTKTFYSPYLKK